MFDQVFVPDVYSCVTAVYQPNFPWKWKRREAALPGSFVLKPEESSVCPPSKHPLRLPPLLIISHKCLDVFKREAAVRNPIA